MVGESRTHKHFNQRTVLGHGKFLFNCPVPALSIWVLLTCRREGPSVDGSPKSRGCHGTQLHAKGVETNGCVSSSQASFSIPVGCTTDCTANPFRTPQEKCLVVPSCLTRKRSLETVHKATLPVSL